MIVLAICYYTFTLLFSLLKGSIHYRSIIGLDSCGFRGFGLVGLHIGISVIVSRLLADSIIKQRVKNSADGIDAGEIPLDARSVKKLMAGGFAAGVLGAALAIGGAPILIPIWLSCGINHNTASSTTPTLILTSSLISFTISAIN